MMRGPFRHFSRRTRSPTGCAVGYTGGIRCQHALICGSDRVPVDERRVRGGSLTSGVCILPYLARSMLIREKTLALGLCVGVLVHEVPKIGFSREQKAELDGVMVPADSAEAFRYNKCLRNCVRLPYIRTQVVYHTGGRVRPRPGIGVRIR
jgi:hypothetical protein